MTSYITVPTFADGTAIIATADDPDRASQNLQNHLRLLELDWKNEEFKSMKATKIQKTNTVRYLGLHLDKKLTWKYHIKQEKQQCKKMWYKLYWLILEKIKNVHLQQSPSLQDHHKTNLELRTPVVG